MTLLLFDLDDTLLGNDMGTFVPAYLQALAKRMSGVADPSILVKTLLAATRQMVENISPEITLEEEFDAAFYPSLGLIRNDVQGIIDAFYAEDFPKLRGLTQFKPEAVELVQQLFIRGDQIAIATNPLFPRTAILQRLSWAGLPADKVPFALIPSYETFHFAKPNPEYFAEFIAQLGWPKIPIIMVGNDVVSDIGAASKLGLPVFWATGESAASMDSSEAMPPHGKLSELIPWLETSPQNAIPANFSTPAALLAVLRSTPAALATMLRHQPANLEKQPGLGEWSPSEVFCHLRDVDTEVNLVRIPKVLSENNPVIPGQDTDRWAEMRKYHLQDGRQALQDFTKRRVELLKMLQDLAQDDWARPARHTIIGPTTLHELVNIIAGHDILHVQQVYKTL